MSAAITLGRGWQKGALGWVIAEHGRYYQDHWGLGAAFEARVAEGLGAFMARFDPARDQFLLAADAAGLLGAISVDGSGPHAAAHGARIRYFIIAERAQGRGIGRRLMGEAMAGIAAAGFERAFLTTFRGLGAARKLYEDFGFALTQEALDSSWGTPLHEQRFDWRAGPG